MTVAGRVRVTNLAGMAGPADPNWSPWAERKFRTPKVIGDGITKVAPRAGWAITSATPVLQWANGRTDVFYYELQLSKDPQFNTDPATATAMVYGALVHGGVTNPPNSYPVPAAFPLEDHTVYYWRVRPRVQGDGVPVAWPAANSFATNVAQETPSWLAAVNFYRTMAALPPVMENPLWNDGCWKHSRYMVKMNILTHQESPTSPWFTPQGDSCGRSGNTVRATRSRGAPPLSPEEAVTVWMRAPFHAQGIVDPQLQQSSFGNYTDTDDRGGSSSAATLDVIRGRAQGPSNAVTKWPAGGRTTTLTSYPGRESPDPLTGCPGYAAPTGLPVLLLLGGAAAVTVSDSAFVRDSAPLEHCMLDERNPNVGGSLASRHTVVIIPRAPLQPGVYAVRVTANGQEYAWSFEVVPE